MCGCSAVGKTTFAKQYAFANECLYLSPDDFYALMNGNEANRDNKFDIWMMLFRAIHNAQEKGISCVVDTNALTRIDRDQFLGWFPGFEHHLVYIEADDCLRQKNNFCRARVIPQDALLKMSAVVEPPLRCELDTRWKSFLHLNNVNNNFIVIEHVKVGSDC